MDRRKFIQGSAGAIGAIGLAGCLGGGGGNDTTTTEKQTTEAKTTSQDTTTEAPTTKSVLPDKVVIGSDIPYKPFEYETNDGKLTGFDVGIAKAVYKGQLGIDYKFKDTSFDTIIQSLNAGNFRVIMSAMTITDKRAEKVDFSDPYFTAYQTIVVRKDSNITSKQDLKGKNAGVQKGTTGADAAKKLKSELGGDLTLKEYDQIPSAFNALLHGQVDAVINDNTVNAAFVNDHGDKVRFVEGDGAAAAQGKHAPPYLTLTVEEYGIAFRKGDDAFRKKVNEALATIKDNGEYKKVYGNYFQG